ncbi:MAG: alpha/beta hydrolase [Steroidobacteraceae bacterium]|nr:alpha/beta hydrolase [Steroidobacteraceae bacterium]
MLIKGYASISAGQIHYRRLHGPGDPIVCLHQTASSSAMWVKFMERLNGERHLVAFDTPGFGGSFDPPGVPASMETYADWIVEAIDFLGISRFHIMSHHTGACIGVEIAHKHPERVLTLAMIGPVPLTDDEKAEFKKHYSTPFAPTADGSYLQTTWDYLKTLGADGDLALHHRELLDTARAYMGRYYAYTNVWRQDFTSPFKKIKAPMLLMAAPDDVLYPYFERARQIRPDADWAELKGANFEPDLDPDGLVAAYRKFMNKHARV